MSRACFFLNQTGQTVNMNETKGSKPLWVQSISTELSADFFILRFFSAKFPLNFIYDQGALLLQRLDQALLLPGNLWINTTVTFNVCAVFFEKHPMCSVIFKTV